MLNTDCMRIYYLYANLYTYMYIRIRKCKRTWNNVIISIPKKFISVNLCFYSCTFVIIKFVDTPALGIYINVRVCKMVRNIPNIFAVFAVCSFLMIFCSI